MQATYLFNNNECCDYLVCPFMSQTKAEKCYYPQLNKYKHGLKCREEKTVSSKATQQSNPNRDHDRNTALNFLKMKHVYQSGSICGHVFLQNELELNTYCSIIATALYTKILKLQFETPTRVSRLGHK